MTASLYDDPSLKEDFHKKINKARSTMRAMDDLPEEIRLALKASCNDLDAEWIAQLLDENWSEAQILMAIAHYQPTSLEPDYGSSEPVADR